MAELTGVRVTLPDGGAYNYLPGPSRPGVSRFVAIREHGWLIIQAVCGRDDGYIVAAYSRNQIRGYELIP